MLRKNRIFVFCLVTILFWFSLYTYVPIISPYALTLGASYKLIGIIIGSYGAAQMILRIPIGILSDKLNKRKIFITFGIILSILSSTIIFIWRTTYSLLLGRTLAGMSAATWVIFTVQFSSYYKNEESPKAIGLINACCFFGETIAMLFCGYISQNHGVQYTFLLAIIISVINIPLSLLISEEKTIKGNSINFKDIIGVVKDKKLILVSLLAIISQLITCSTIFGFTPIAAKHINATNLQISLLTTISTLPMIFASLLGGTLFANKIGEKKSIIIGFFMNALACICIPYAKTITWLFITQAFGGFFNGMVFSLLMSLSIKNVSMEIRASAMGFFQAIYGLGMFLGPVVVGLLGDWIGLKWGFFSIACIAIVGSLISTKINVE